jgi:hypothetical protein
VNDLLGLITICVIISLVGAYCVYRFGDYDPEGDLCDHGKRVADGEKCLRCIEIESEI